MDNEIWRKISGYEGVYEISSLGRVRSLDRFNNKPQFVRGRIMRLNLSGNHGYPSVMLTIDGVQTRLLVHRLVADAFVENPENKPEVNHINGNRKDPRVTNLEWVTRSENHLHSYRNLGRKAQTQQLGFDAPKPVVGEGDCGTIQFPSITAAERGGFNAGLLRDCLVGKRQSYKGYAWRYA